MTDQTGRPKGGRGDARPGPRTGAASEGSPSSWHPTRTRGGGERATGDAQLPSTRSDGGG